ncbi:MAG: hypothetical protein HFJ45_07190 [Clostridia bacterium]|nr:hypothetical protein [Clostridia bacterium]
MNCFDDFITEEELKEIEKHDCLFSFRVISLDDKKKRKYLNSFAYQQYLKQNAEDNKGGADNE